MYTLLPEILNMSITAGLVIVLVLIARLLLKKAPKIFSYMLWAVVLFRLVCPVSFSSDIALIGLFNAPALTTNDSPYSSITYIPHNIVHTEYPRVDLPLPGINEAINENLPKGEEQLAADPLEGPMAMATLLWLLGIAAMLIYSAVSLLLLRRKLIGAVRYKDNIYLADHISTPFVIGLIRPKIYLPSTISEQEQSYIILHEKTHIRRLDHIVKMLAFLTLAMHWFNPLVWVAFVCAAKDMEMSCDESVLKQMGGEIRTAYSTSLLSLSAGRGLISGSPLAFGEGNLEGRIKNIMNFKKPAFWVVAIAVIACITSALLLSANPVKTLVLPQPAGSVSINNLPDSGAISNLADSRGINDLQEQVVVAEGTAEPANNSIFNRVKITFVSGISGSKSADEFETTASKIVTYIYSSIQDRQHTEEVIDLNKNYINKYILLLSNDVGGSSYSLYYDTLYNKAYIAGDGGLSETTTDFARYVDSLLENTDINIAIDDTDAAALFKKYGWTLDYQISGMNDKLNNITVLTGFNPNAYYFAYNNVLSADIGLDMSRYSKSANIDVEIYRIRESMPQEFYPAQNCRGIVVRENGKIIGAFISAGRHSAFNACSLKGNSFEKAAGQTLEEWLIEKVQADATDKKLSKLEPEQVIEEYFTALNERDAQTAKGCISKKTMLGNLTSNMQNGELFSEGHTLLLIASDDLKILKSSKILKVELIDEQPDENTKAFNVIVDLQYNMVVSIDSGEQSWDCVMVYESPQTGWKIDSFGH